MRNQVFKKLFSVLLALIMVAGLLPASVLAEGWTAADVATTPAPTETEQPAEPTPGQGEPVAEPTPEQGEPTAEPVPTQGEPTAEPAPTQGEPTAEPTDEGIMPANVMPVQANVAARDTRGDDYYRIVHLDCGRKYFDVNYIKGIIDTMYLNGYNQLQLAFGNGGLRFVLDGMSQDLKGAIAQGNKKFYDSTTNELTQAEMTEIISYAKEKNIEIVPLLNMPGHMDGILSSDNYSGYKLSGSEGSLDLNNENAVAFGKELLSMYVEYFKTQGCKFFNFGADEYGQGIRNPYIESSVAKVTYDQLINYMNACAEIIENAGMTARCFNDFVCYNNRTSCDLKKSVQVCYWSNQWNGSEYNTVDVINNAGYKLINTNQKWYFVPSKADEYSKTTVLANFKTFDVTKFQNIKSGWNSTSTTYSEIIGGNNVGAMFCVWCDKPAVAVDLSDVKDLIAAMADANPTYFTKVTIPNTTVGNVSGNATTADNDTVRVTGPNLAALTAPEHTGKIVGIKAVDGRIKAYDVTPSTADSNYTEKAEVRIKIPAEWDSSKVIAFIVESDGTVEDIVDGKVEDGWYVFTAPHFSVMGIYEKAAMTEGSRTITIVEGKEEVLTVDGNLTGNEIGDPADTAVATKTGVEYGTKPGEGTQFTLGNKITTGDGVISDGKGNYMVVSEKGEISNTTEIAKATVFTVTPSSGSGYWTTYTIQVKGKNQYLTINNNNKLAIQNSSSSWDYYDGYGFYMYYYYLKFNNGWTASTRNGTSGYLYKRAESPNLVDITKITFKGIKSGTTTVTIAGEEYTIEVKAAELEDVVLPINLWITNTGVVPTEWSNGNPVEFSYEDTAGNRRSIYTLKASHSTVNSPNGISLSSILPKVTGTAKSWDGKTYNVTYWKSAYHTAENRQSTDGWTNYSHKGTKFEYIRFYEGSWAYSVDGNTWVNIENVGAGADDTTKNQVCIWYRQVTTVTSEVTTEIVDWGPIEYSANQCLLDFAVKYDGTSGRIPNSFPVTGKTMGFACPTDQSVPLGNGYVVKDTDGTYYRTVYGIAGVETSNYEVYMITLTPSSDSHNVYINSGSTQTSYTYGGTEKIAWAKTEADTEHSVLGKISGVQYGGEPFLESVKIYQYQGLLVTYYLRAKQTSDSLTVHYAIQGSDTAFYEYNIVVNSGTFFSDNIGLGNPKVGPLNNGTVVNSDGRTIEVSSDLSDLQDVDLQYRYSIYEVVGFRRESAKSIWIYYTFTRDHTYVIDFGLPLEIKLKDFGITTENMGDIDSISLASMKDKEAKPVHMQEWSHGKAEVLKDTDGNWYVKYILAKPLSNNITIPLYVKFNQRGDNDKPQLFTANIIPATNVYYEDSFAKFTDGSGTAKDAKWTIVKNDGGPLNEQQQKDSYTNQALEALGQENHNPYGYDPAYDSCTMFSMGSARKVTVTQDMATTDVVWPTAQFTFKGTGFDIISLTDNTSGAIFVEVTRKVNGEEVTERSVFVDNYYGYTYDKENDTWKVEPNNPNAIYQVPVIKVSGLDYDEYKVVIKVAYNTFFDDASAGSYSFWLDAVRVYDPMGKNDSDTYAPDGEARPVFVEVRKALIKQDSFNGGNENIAGAVFIDGKAEGATIDDYKNFGPNHEVYLAGNQAIAFRIVADRKPDTVQIGVKLANGSSGELILSGSNAKFAAYGDANENAKLKLSTATDMYYALNGITWTQEENGSQKSNVIVLTNTGSGIVSITNVKCTYASITENTTNAVTLAISYDDALMAVDAVNNAITPVEPEPEPEPEPEKTFEPDRFEASWSRNVMQGRKATLTVKTSEDVEAITVDGQTIRSYRTRTERVGFGRRAKRVTYREFTYSMEAQESADFSVTAINAEGTESEAITARLTVKTRPNSMRDMWDWFKGWF